MNDVKDFLELSGSLKAAIKENRGEVSYWGDSLEPALVGPAPQPLMVTSSASSSDKVKQLDHLRNEVIGDCQRCGLCASRKKIVFGVGNLDAAVMFVGEGPGFDEDRMGEPFVGKGGQLLDKILAAIQLDRTKVYIANVVKCHPMVDPTQPEKRGNDRPPFPDEMEECLPFLRAQIAIVQPRIVVTLGGVATKALLQTRDGITKLRGRLCELRLTPEAQPIPLLPTYHPAALLRDPELKKPVWEDMKLLRDFLNA